MRNLELIGGMLLGLVPTSLAAIWPASTILTKSVLFTNWHFSTTTWTCIQILEHGLVLLDNYLYDHIHIHICRNFYFRTAARNRLFGAMEHLWIILTGWIRSQTVETQQMVARHMKTLFKLFHFIPVRLRSLLARFQLRSVGTTLCDAASRKQFAKPQLDQFNEYELRLDWIFYVCHLGHNREIKATNKSMDHK